jgi:hypothetical protein
MVGAASSALHPNGIIATRVTLFSNNGFAEVFWVSGRDRHSLDIALPG